MRKGPPHQLNYRTPTPRPQGPNWLISRAAFLLCFLLLILLTVATYAHDRWLAVVMTTLTEGGITALWLLCAWGWGARIARLCRARFSERNAPPLAEASPTSLPDLLRPITAIALGLGLIGLLTLFLGLAGALNRITASLILLLGPAISAPSWLNWLAAKRHVRADHWFAQPAGAIWLFLFAAPAVGMMLVGASITPGLLWKPEDPHPYDALEYHLQVPREWYEIGRITGLHHNVYSYFPYGVEMHYLLAMHVRGGAWAAMYKCQYLSIAWTLLTAAAVYATVGRHRKLLATSAALLVLATPWFPMLASVAYTESALALYTALAVAWIFRALDSPAPTRPLLLAGLATGFACGVKYTAIPMVLIVLMLAMATLGLLKRRDKPWWIGLTLFTATSTALASPWLIRNAIWTGNPVFPLAMKTLGQGHFDDTQVQRFAIAHAAPQADQPLPRRLARAATEIFANWQYGYLIWLAPVAALALSFRRPQSCLLLAFLAANLLIWIFATHLLSRFYVLAIPVAAMSLALLPDTRWPTIAALAAALSTIIGLALLHPRLERFSEIARNGLFGLEDLSFFNPPELADMERSDKTVWLIGDAQGFLYRFPSRQLRYRTVFDIKGDARNMYEAWTALPEDQVKGIIVLNPMEVQRLSQTYHHVPTLPQTYPGPRDRTVILQR